MLACFEAAGATWAARSEDDDEADALFAARRLAYPALERLGPVLTEDVCVPDRPGAGDAGARSRRSPQRHDVLIANIAHAGDGNLHPLLITPPGDDAARIRAQAAFDEIITEAPRLRRHGHRRARRRPAQAGRPGRRALTGGDRDAPRDPPGPRPARDPQPRQGRGRALRPASRRMREDGAVSPQDDAAQSLAELRRRADELARAQRPGPPAGRRCATPARCSTRWPRQARRLLGGRRRLHHAAAAPATCCGSRWSTGRWGRRCAASSSTPGQGLGGQVLADRPAAVERAATSRTPASRTADRSTPPPRSEQLGGILGVPLIVGDETIGVLLAAERRARDFADQEVELLAALAAHARRRHPQRRPVRPQRAAATELREANAALREVSETASVRATCATAQRGGDQRRRTPGRSSTARTARPGSRSSCATPTAARWRARRRRGGLVVPVACPSGHGGDLSPAPTAAPDEEALRLLGSGPPRWRLLASERSLAEAELRTRGEFVHALLSSDADAASLRPPGPRDRHRPRPVAAVAVFDAGPVERAPRPFAARLAADLQRLVGGARAASWSCWSRGVEPGPCAVARLTGRAPAAARHRSGRLRRRAGRRPGGVRGGAAERRGAARARPRRRPARRARTSGSTARCSARPAATSSTTFVAPPSARCSTTTASASATWPPPWRRTSSRPSTTPAPARPCTSTPTRSTSGSTGSPSCSARGGRTRPRPGLQVALRLHRLMPIPT